MRALIVEDLKPMRDILKKMLRQMPYFEEIDETGDGEEGWSMITEQAAAESPYDIIFCDVRMEVLDGIGLLKRCRSHPAFRFLPFFMISASSEESNIISALGEWEANNFLVKPFSFDLLAKRVEATLKQLQSPEEELFREVHDLRKIGATRAAMDKIENAEMESRLSLARWLNAKGECLLQEGDVVQAAIEFGKSMDIGKIYITAYKNYAIAQQMLGNVDQAIEALKCAESMSPKDNDRTLLLGRLLLQTGQKEAAERLMESAVRRCTGKEKAVLLRQIAEVHLEHGNLEEAEKRLTASLQFHSSDVETYNRLGLVLRKQRKYEKALQCYQMALTVHPEHGGIYYNMGILFATKGDYDSARVYFESALAVDPNFEEARKMLQRMDRMGESSV